MDFSQFSRTMRERSKNVPIEVHESVVNTAKAYVITAADVTPVDTGTAMSNWRIGVNSPPTGVIPPYFPGMFRSTAAQNLVATINAAVEASDASKPGDILYIVNNTEYIGDLNNGSSSQAPSGMTAIAELVALRIQTTAKVVNPK